MHFFLHFLSKIFCSSKKMYYLCSVKQKINDKHNKLHKYENVHLFSYTNQRRRTRLQWSFRSVYRRKDRKKKFVTKQIKYQADLWGVTPTLYRVAKGSFVQYEVKHKEQDLKMYYTLQVINK